MSQISDLGLSFYFMGKKRETFWAFLKIFFIDCI